MKFAYNSFAYFHIIQQFNNNNKNITIIIIIISKIFENIFALLNKFLNIRGEIWDYFQKLSKMIYLFIQINLLIYSFLFICLFEFFFSKIFDRGKKKINKPWKDELLHNIDWCWIKVRWKIYAITFC